MTYTIAHFHYKYRKQKAFRMTKTGPKNWHLVLTPEDPDFYAGWRKMEHLVDGEASYNLVGSQSQCNDTMTKPYCSIGCDGRHQQHFIPNLTHPNLNPVRVKLQDDVSHFHIKGNPVWNREGYCYLQVMREYLLHTLMILTFGLKTQC